LIINFTDLAATSQSLISENPGNLPFTLRFSSDFQHLHPPQVAALKDHHATSTVTDAGVSTLVAW
jgi:hypothetical protein